MSIARLKKMTLCGLTADKSAMLEGLQKLGCMHLLPLSPPSVEAEKPVSTHAEAAYKALRFLNDAPQKRRQVVRDTSFEVDTFVHKVLELKQTLRDARDRRDFLQQRISAVELWGDINFPPKEALADYHFWFYILPLHKLSALEKIAVPWQIVRKDSRHAYVVVIAQQEPSRDLLPVAREHLGALPLTELQHQLEDTEIKLEDLRAQRLALTRYIYLLSVNLAEADNRASLTHAAEQTRDDERVVAVQGWVPDEAVAEVKALANRARLACLIEEPNTDDTPPTLIDQPEPVAAGVDLTLFYQVPGYRSWDPTWLLWISFSIFFAMILADAGYGLVLMAGLCIAWQRLGQSTKGRSYRLLGLSLFGCTIVYGAMVGSYFGLTPADDSLLGFLHIMDINDFDTMMRLSIIVGVLHIGFANLMMAWVYRGKSIAFAKLGWMAAIAGGLLFWLTDAASGWRSVASVIIATAVLMIVLFSSERPINKVTDYIWRLLDGIFSLKNTMNAFGDVLSYMRLFALGLASASLAITFNNLAKDAYTALPGLGFLIALLILVIGHLLNLGLSFMSGVIHGLRLNFIEFYNWGLPEDGTVFRRFSRKEVKS